MSKHGQWVLYQKKKKHGQWVKFLGSPIITMEEALSNNNEAKSKCTIRIKYSLPIND